MQDYTHQDDFDHSDADWIDATRLLSVYEEQLDLNSDLWRHRHTASYGPWRRGPAPDNKKPATE